MIWRKWLGILILLFTMLSLISACSGMDATKSTPAPKTIKFAALKVLDSLPLYVAEQEGYFKERNLDVQIVPVSSAPERDQLIASNQAQGMINEMVSTLFSNRDKITIEVVRNARTATKEQPVFRLLSAKKSGIKTVADLKNVQTGISQGTVIEYLFNRLVEAEGFDSKAFPIISIPSISDRMALLNKGDLKAAILPEPLSSLAQQQGAVVVIDDSSHPEYGYSTIAFRKDFIDQNPAAMTAFLAAYEQAVTAINANPDKYKNLLTQRELVPPPLVGSYKMPSFVTASVPSEAQFQDALKWVKTKGLIDKNLEYKEAVNSSFLPK